MQVGFLILIGRNLNERQEGENQGSRSKIGWSDENVKIRTSTSQRKDRQGKVKEYGNPNGLKCVYFNSSSIVEKSDEFRARIGVWANIIKRGTQPAAVCSMVSMNVLVMTDREARGGIARQIREPGMAAHRQHTGGLIW